MFPRLHACGLHCFGYGGLLIRQFLLVLLAVDIPIQHVEQLVARDVVVLAERESDLDLVLALHIQQCALVGLEFEPANVGF